MGKHGPCYHCGVTSTPLWRNGPPEKPVLCNACGSRWRTKGTLENYTPLHSRAEADGDEDRRVYKVKTFPVKNKEATALKRKYDSNATESGGVSLDYNSQGFQRVFDEDTSNRSSSGSAISNSESCAQYCCTDANDLAGPSQPTVCDSIVPSRKRRCTAHLKLSPVEKLTKDLYTIWHEQQSLCLSSSLDDDLLVESDKPMVSVEIGHGSVLIRHPISITREEESEASSLYIDKNRHGLSSQPTALPSLTDGREKGQPEKLEILAHHNSPLGLIDLQESKGKSVIEEPETVKSNALATDYSLSATRPQDGVNQKFSGAKAIMRSPKRVVMRSSCNNEEVKIDEDRSFTSPKRLFFSDFSNESCEEDLLLVDIPCNSSTLLYSYFGP